MFAGTVLFQKEAAQRIEQQDLFSGVVRHAELREQGLQQFDIRECGVYKLGGHILGAKLLDHRVQDGGLADPDLAGDDYEAVTVQQCEPAVCYRPGVLSRHENEFRVRRQVERAALQMKEFFVHSGPSFRQGAGSGRLTATYRRY